MSIARCIVASLLVGVIAAGSACSQPQVAAASETAAMPQTQDGALPRSVVRPRREESAEVDVTPVPEFEYAYEIPESPGLQEVYRRIKDADLLRQLPEVQAINGMFQLPRHLRFVTAQCDEYGAFYLTDKAEVMLCYETLSTLYARAMEQQLAQGLEAGHAQAYVLANVRFIVLHETGHALVDLLDLPVTGRLEDAVDQLAAILMLRFSGLDETPSEVIGNLRMAASGMLSQSTGSYDLDAYADEHALGEQRYFNLQCLIYGTDPKGFGNMIEDGDLTAARAAGCASETRRVSRAWVRLLLPHLAPGFEAYEDEAERYLKRSK